MLNPQPSGAGFVGVKSNLTEILEDVYEGVEIVCRAQGQLKYWKVVLNPRDSNIISGKYSYESKFLMDTDSEEFQTIRLSLSEFSAYYRGSVVLDAPPLMISDIGALGLQTFGGVYDEYKQGGVGSLEIDRISLF